ncbi:hypothetical protein [Catellatospora methionotrophica]|uniref:hypothetical protein n=1 Tax=Catellatospora methionotrophica TaxID=121620 RepID=UPI0033F89E18
MDNKLTDPDPDIREADQAYQAAIREAGQAQDNLATRSAALASLLLRRLHPTAAFAVVAVNESRKNYFESVYHIATIRDPSGQLLWQCSTDVNGDPTVDRTTTQAGHILRAGDLFGVADGHRADYWDSCQQGDASIAGWPFDTVVEDEISADRCLILIPIA